MSGNAINRKEVFLKAKLVNKKVMLEEKVICCGDKNVYKITFESPAEIDGIICENLPVYVKTENALGSKCKTLLTSVKSGDNLLIEWFLGEEATLVSGKLKCQLSFEDYSGALVLNSEIFEIEIHASVSEVGPKATPEYNQITQLQNTLMKLIEEVVVKTGDGISKLENDVGYLTAEDVGGIGGGSALPSVSADDYKKILEVDANGKWIVSDVLKNLNAHNFVVDESGKTLIQALEELRITRVERGQSYQENGSTVTPVTLIKNDGNNLTFNVYALNGEKGEQGEKGDKGDQGDKGEQGVSIVNVSSSVSVQNGNYTVTPIIFTDSNNSKKTVNVYAKNGENTTSSVGSGAIIDVEVLPESEINSKALYRMKKYEYYSKKNLFMPMTCNVVEYLPETAENFYKWSHIITYYELKSEENYAYVSEDFADEISVKPGWYPYSEMCEILGYNYGGMVKSLEDAENEEYVYLYQKTALYYYDEENEQFKEINYKEENDKSKRIVKEKVTLQELKDMLTESNVGCMVSFAPTSYFFGAFENSDVFTMYGLFGGSGIITPMGAGYGVSIQNNAVESFKDNTALTIRTARFLFIRTKVNGEESYSIDADLAESSIVSGEVFYEKNSLVQYLKDLYFDFYVYH